MSARCGGVWNKEGNSGSVPTPDDLRESCDEYFSSRKNGFELLSAPDGFITWLLSILHNRSDRAPVLTDEEWDRSVSLLAPHRILPYIAYHLQRMPGEMQPPARVGEILKKNLLWSSCISELAIRQAADVSTACTRAGIGTLVMKSPGTGLAVYPVPGLRTGGDIDLLVAPDQYHACREVLERLGYRTRYDSYRIFSDFYHHTCFFPPTRNDKVIELHWRPVFLPGPGGKVKAPDLIRRRRSLTTRHGDIAVFDLTDALFYHAIHMSLFHEPILRLSWVCDISLLAQEITSRNLWPEVIRACPAWEGRYGLERALSLASLWTGYRMPHEWDFSHWPAPGPDDLYAILHMRRRRAGRELLLHQILARTPTFRKKIRATYHWAFRPDLIHDTHPGMTWWESPGVYLRQLYENSLKIRW